MKKSNWTFCTICKKKVVSGQSWKYNYKKDITNHMECETKEKNESKPVRN